jgi:tripartite-type tricarboxylate transporter receptor subunit TctC
MSHESYFQARNQMVAAGTAMSALVQPRSWRAPWPTKPISNVGYPPGGFTDAGARFISAVPGSLLCGAQIRRVGNIAAAEVMTLWGYKLLVAITSFTINPHLLFTARPNGVHTHRADPSRPDIVVNPSSPAKTLASSSLGEGREQQGLQLRHVGQWRKRPLSNGILS